MVRKMTVVLILVTFGVMQFGCATTPKPEGAQTNAPSPAPSPAGRAVGGAILGTLGGAAIGALVGMIPGGSSLASNVARGALSGAVSGLVTGAIAGFMYGKYEEKLYRDRQAAEAFYKYQAQQGEKVVLEVVEVNPRTAVQGENVSLNCIFTVLTGKDEAVPLELSHVIMAQDKICGQPFSQKIEKVSGTYGVTIPMHIPNNAPNGQYKLITFVKTTQAGEMKMCEFMVAKKAESTPKPVTPEQPGAPEEKGAPEGRTTG